jgi:hypothetical protein
MDTGDKRARDLVLYIAAALAALIVAGGIYAAHSGKTTKEIFVAVVLFLLSLALFGMLLRDFRAHWKTARCWMTLSFLFVIHLSAGALALHFHPFDAKALLLVLILIAPEYQVLKVFVSSVLNA